MLDYFFDENFYDDYNEILFTKKSDDFDYLENGFKKQLVKLPLSDVEKNGVKELLRKQGFNTMAEVLVLGLEEEEPKTEPEIEGGKIQKRTIKMENSTKLIRVKYGK